MANPKPPARLVNPGDGPFERAFLVHLLEREIKRMCVERGFIRFVRCWDDIELGRLGSDIAL